MEDIIKIVLNWAIPVILAGIFGFMIKMINDNKAVKASILSLIRSQIVGKCESYMKKGFLPDYARSCLTDLFAQYTALGGNHGVNILVDETLKLPPVKET